MFKQSLLMMGLLGASGLTVAAGLYGYGGLGSTYSHSDYDERIWSTSTANNDNTVVSTLSNRFSAKLGIGYEFCDYGAIEASAFWLGKARYGVRATERSGSNTPLSSMGTIAGQAFALDLLGRWPINETFTPFVKAGVALVHAKVESEAVEATYTFSHSKTRLAPKLGLGLDVSLTPHLALRLEAEQIFNAAKENIGSQGQIFMPNLDYTIGTVGLLYRF